MKGSENIINQSSEIAKKAGFASYVELGEPGTKVLNRLVEEGRLREMRIGCRRYYDVVRARELIKEFRTIPEGYVAAGAYAQKLGLTKEAGLNPCRDKEIPAVRRSADGKKGTWYAPEAVLRRLLAKKHAYTPPAPVQKSDALLEAKRRADAELKSIMSTGNGPSFLARHGQPGPAPASNAAEQLIERVVTLVEKTEKRNRDQDTRAVAQHREMMRLIQTTRELNERLTNALATLKGSTGGGLHTEEEPSNGHVEKTVEFEVTEPYIGVW